MTGLQETFYIMAIVFMALNFLLFIALLTAVFVIRAKVNKIHDMVNKKLAAVTNVAEKGGELSAIAGSVIAKKTKRALSKKK